MKRRQTISLRDILPVDLPALLVEGSKLGMGLDVATTEKETSNPSALALTEQIGRDYIVRLLMRWKTGDDAVTLAIVRSILQLIAPRRVRSLCIDASNERFFAAGVRRALAGVVPVTLVVSSESTVYLGEQMSNKVYLNNQLINLLDDGRLILPNEQWVADDFRLVKRSRGTFITETDATGNHGDGFDAVKLSIDSLGRGGGEVEASGIGVGSFGKLPDGRRLHNPYAHLFTPTFKINA